MIRKERKKEKNPRARTQKRRKLSIRKKVWGTGEVPRLCAIKTNKNLLVQVVDDDKGVTLFSLQTFGKNKVGTKSVEGAKELGTSLAGRLKEKGFNRAVFDRNGNKYTGVLSSLASSLREGGIQI